MQVALLIDTPNLESLEPILDELQGLPILAWIGASSFIALGPSVIHHLRLAGFDSYLDLRLCGEVASVRRSIEAVRRQGALGVTIDLAMGAAAARAAKQAARGRLDVIGVAAPLDSCLGTDERLQIAVDERLDGVLGGPALVDSVAEGAALYVRSDEVVQQASVLIVEDRILASASPRAACEALFAELL